MSKNLVLGMLLLGAAVPALVLADVIATVMGFVPLTSVYFSAALAIATVVYFVARPNGVYVGLASSLAFAVLLTGLFFYPVGYRKQFVRSVRGIERGTHRADVARILDGFERGHPYGGNHGPVGREEPGVDYWHHGRGGQMFNYDHCVIHYGPGDRVRQVELFLD